MSFLPNWLKQLAAECPEEDRRQLAESISHTGAKEMKTFTCMSMEQALTEATARRAKGNIVVVDEPAPGAIDWYDEDGIPHGYISLLIWENQAEFDSDGF